MICGLTSNVCLLLFLYFIQGLPYGIQTHFLPVYLRTRGVDLTRVSLFRLLQLPWLVKVLWAPFIDRYSTQRRWLLMSTLLLAVSCVMSAVNSPDSLSTLALVSLFLCNIFASVQDVAVDAVAVSMLSSEEVAAGNVAQIVGYKLGAAFAGGILALLVGVLGWFGLCCVMAAIYAEAAMLIQVSPTMQRYDICQDTRRTLADDKETNNIRCRHHEHARCRILPSQTMNNHEDIHCSMNSHENMHCSAKHTDISTTKKRKLLMFLSYTSLRHPATVWLLVFLLIYKLGEQGALAMMPMFLLDEKVDAAELTFWSGVVGQVVSICGSLLGGWLITAFSQIPMQFMMLQVCLLRLLPIGLQLLVIVIWNTQLFSSSLLIYVALLSLMLLTLLGGIVTTITFTLMMRSTQSVSRDIQATYYTTLATVEVMGKLIFTSSCGWLATLVGYRLLFLSFIVLSAVALIWIQKCPSKLDDIKVTSSPHDDD